ncbi:TPR end-of-group domain-containing protein [Flavobacterium ustbae]|uniref:TPR end-of-group domain-containing protein n=1 Tax=Flavobacterium ustbae TaxID=2488790 RepID=UPI000F793C60|nr:SIR2 family protein [Flavobacterium ustbae]
MNTATIEDLAYLINQAKQENLPKPIVFLGAGASKSGGVPLATEITKDILIKYADKPNIKNLEESDKTYPILMSCLTPFERNKLLKQYIEEAKINVTHIYLAQLIINGYIDYVLTVNFDNLMLRALALFNEFPPTYDMAILKDLTTTSFKEKSVVYLHGQHHGLWLLNTKEEMAKVNEMIPPILSSIKNQRAWVFIGYSGEDPIFHHVTKLGRFDNGLYWISYNQNNPCDRVCSELLEKENTNAFLIKGYDSDSFMLQLNSELKLPQPAIIDTPFTSLSLTLENIVDIEDKEHFKGVKERLEIVKKDVQLAIQQFEKGEMVENKVLKESIDKNLLHKEIIDEIINKNFNESKIQSIEKKYENLNDPETNELLAEYYRRWADDVGRKALAKKDKELFVESFKLYEKASVLDTNNYNTFNNWGAKLYDYANVLEDELKDKFYNDAISKCKKAINIGDVEGLSYQNWAYILRAQAILKKDEKLYFQSIEKFKLAFEKNENDDKCLFVWAKTLGEIANLKEDRKLLEESTEKYNKATDLNPFDENIFIEWGNTISKFAQSTKDQKLHEEAFEKFATAKNINPKNCEVFYAWGSSVAEYAKLHKKTEAFEESLKLLSTAVNLGSKNYNLACLYAVLDDKVNSFALLEKSLKDREVPLNLVMNDSDWDLHKNDDDFKQIISRHE